MALCIYTQPNESSKLSIDSSGLAPLLITINGQTGGAIDKILYVRNDNYKRWYSNIRLDAIDTSGGYLVDGSQGWAWFLSTGNVHPTNDQWVDIVPATQIVVATSLGSSLIGDTGTYLPFWIRVQVPPQTPVCNLNLVVTLRLMAIEHFVA